MTNDKFETWDMDRTTTVRRSAGVLGLVAGMLCILGLSLFSSGASAATSKWTMYPFGYAPPTMTTKYDSVGCASTGTCVAVGSSIAEGQPRMSAEYWNGASWSMKSLPGTGAVSVGSLYDVACVSASSCTAVGSYFTKGGEERPYAANWNGTTWSLLPAVELGGVESGLKTVSCFGTQCLAMGTFNSGSLPKKQWAAVYNGTSGTAVNLSTYLGVTNDVFCRASNDCLAVGASGSSKAQALRWNGTSFAYMTLPSIAESSESSLEGIACQGVCEAVGFSKSTSTSARVPLAEVWDGTTWSVQAVPNPAGSTSTTLTDVSCNTYCVASGNYSTAATGSRPLAERLLNVGVPPKGSWEIDMPKYVEGFGNSAQTMTGISCASATKCMGVGTYRNGSNILQPFSEQVIRE